MDASAEAGKGVIDVSRGGLGVDESIGGGAVDGEHRATAEVTYIEARPSTAPAPREPAAVDVDAVDALREAFSDYLTAARRVDGRSSRTSPGSASKRGEPEEFATIREWANANGHEVASRGRIGQAVRAAYDAAHRHCSPHGTAGHPSGLRAALVDADAALLCRIEGRAQQFPRKALECIARDSHAGVRTNLAVHAGFVDRTTRPKRGVTLHLGSSIDDRAEPSGRLLFTALRMIAEFEAVLALAGHWLVTAFPPMRRSADGSYRLCS